MLTVTNTSSDATLLYTPTDKAPYFIIHTTLFVIDMSESVATDIIAKFTANEFSSIKTLSLQQYDIYRDLTEYKAGLKKLFEYFIFDNQWFIENSVNIVAPNDTFYKAAEEQILASQKLITKTQSLFPAVEKNTLDTNPIAEEMRGGIVLTTVSPIETITLDITLAKSYEEILDILDPTKDDAVKGTYHLLRHIQHDIIKFAMGRTIAKFYGSLTTVKDSTTGEIDIDIHKVVKEEEKYVAASTGSE